MTRRTILITLAAAGAILVSPPAYAQEKTFRDWTVGVLETKEGLYAATANESDGIFGEFCYRSNGRCYWLLGAPNGCEEGSKYPVLVNSDAGAISTTVECKQKTSDGRPRYAFVNYSEIESILEGTKWVGIAFPLQSGRFRVSRFSLDGAAAAVAFMEKTMKAVLENAAAETTRDEVY